jgi:hypothetical protein
MNPSKVMTVALAIFAVAVLLLLAPPLLGQTPSLEPGTSLRVHADGLTLSGAFVRWDSDTLVLRPEGTASGLSAERAIAVSEVLGVDHKVPRSHGRGAARGALWGALIGGVVGVMVGAVQETDCFLCPSSHTEGAVMGGVALGVVGTGVGALVGVIVPGEQWEPVPLDSLAGSTEPPNRE